MQRTGPSLRSSTAHTSSSHSTSNYPPPLPRSAHSDGLTFSSDYEDPEALPLHHIPASRSRGHPHQLNEMDTNDGAQAPRRRGAPGPAASRDQEGETEQAYLSRETEKAAYGAGKTGPGGAVGGARRDRPAYKPPAKTWVSTRSTIRRDLRGKRGGCEQLSWLRIRPGMRVRTVPGALSSAGMDVLAAELTFPRDELGSDSPLLPLPSPLASHQIKTHRV